ncbi:cilia- and flagella-associated protein 206 [Diabrotica virgifera virgifera]|uniref:Cilia- and flagella-associated protein 206 n=1 Tax=Diabrotica virgifera virgifera TaxID=50390 RepID=A0A6P7FDZ7_DIAVI|nr:cilia- and flagella-associated protein 206 [Diabrotica virgifera virgifera]
MSIQFEVHQTIKNIVREIVKEFAKLPNIVADQNLITFYVKLLLHDPNWQVEGKVLLAREKIQKFIRFVVNQFQRDKEPDIVAIKIQHSFSQTFKRKHEIANQRRENLAERLGPLRVAILERRRTDTDLSNLFHQVVVYFVLFSGMGDPTIPEIYKHNKVVVSSVLTNDELKEFVNKPYVVRQEELSTMVKVCTGIRIFNMNCNRGDKGVPNLPDLTFNAIDALSDNLEYIIGGIAGQIDILSEAISSCFEPFIAKQQVLLKIVFPENSIFDRKDVEYCIHLVLVYKQFQEAIQFLAHDVAIQKRALLKIYQQYNEIIAELNSTVVPNFHIHVDTVFPHFIQLSEIWSTFQDSVVLLNIFKRVVKHLDKLVNKLEFSNSLVTHYLNIVPQKFYDESGLNLSDIFEDASADCKIYTKHDVEVLSCESGGKVFYEYEGHCCWRLVLTNGFLLKGSEMYGIVNYNSRYYIFSSPLAVKCFAKEPDYYINYVLHLARKRCGLILYLKLSEDLINAKNKLDLVTMDNDQTVTYAERECQCEPDIEDHIDRSYHHSLWWHRAQALQVAKLQSCKTVSTMTDKTFCKNTSHVQTYTKKDKQVTTTSKKSTNTPTPLSFIYGLRNDREGKRQAHLNLTFWEFKSELQKINE